MKGFKTIAVNILGLIYLILSGTGVVPPVVDVETIAAGLGVSNVLLRFITSSAVFSKG